MLSHSAVELATFSTKSRVLEELQGEYLIAMNKANEVVVEELKKGCISHGYNYIDALAEKRIDLEISEEGDKLNTRYIKFILTKVDKTRAVLVATKDNYEGVTVYKGED